MKRRKFNILNAFLLSRSERTGLLTLLSLPAVAMAFHYTLPTRFSSAPTNREFIAYYTESPKPSPVAWESETREEDFFPFNPNEISKSTWVSLGLSPYQADGVLRFKNKIGGFESRRDLERVYVLPEGWFDRHRNDILLPEEKPKPQYTEHSTSKTNQFTTEYSENKPARISIAVELNGADSVQLIGIRGVGAKSARQVLRYRNALGGFHSLEQLTEIRYLHPSVLEKLSEVAVIDSNMIQRMNLNEVTVEELAKHPYLSWKMAQSIIDMRTHRTKFHHIDDLLEHHRMSDSLFQRIRPYIYVE